MRLDFTKFLTLQLDLRFDFTKFLTLRLDLRLDLKKILILRLGLRLDLTKNFTLRLDLRLDLSKNVTMWLDPSTFPSQAEAEEGRAGIAMKAKRIAAKDRDQGRITVGIGKSVDEINKAAGNSLYGKYGEAAGH